ncbi:MAG TPA: hypothetical protein VM711_04990 [Sphingomicrobium sp.]|nr:hypothetical protein [Sphingomicrobium sp.]
MSIAIAIASGPAPKAGMIAAVISGLLISLPGGSRVQTGGRLSRSISQSEIVIPE